MNANLTTAPAETVELTNGKTPCNCSDGCPGLTTRFFSQGHDARMVTRLRNAVQAGEISLQDAFAEVIKRGGTERLQIKLDAAVANARKPRKSKKAAKVIDTFELGEFCLAAMPLASEPNVVARPNRNRWEYRGEVLTYQIVEDGKISKGDTVLVFEYDNKQGERQQTTVFSRVAVDEEFAAPADEEVEVLYSSDAIEAEAAAEFAAREGGLRRVTNSGPADEDTSDIPF